MILKEDMMSSFGVGPAEMLFFGLVALMTWLPWPLIGGYVARQKQREVIEGVLLRLVGPVGVLIEALLPIKPTSSQ